MNQHVSIERRRSSRIKALKGALAVFDGGACAYNCIVRNISATGAKVVFESTMGLPEMFELHLVEGQTYSARIAWRGLTEVGVELSPVVS